MSTSKRASALSSRFTLIGIGILALITRILFAFHTPFGSDEIAIYNHALDYYLSGKLPTTGAAIVYSGTALPGSLLPLLTGLPLHFSQGMPWGPVVFLAIWNLLTSILIFIFYQTLFPRFHRPLLFALIAFAPWGLVFGNLWNPNYLPFFSTLFLIGMIRIMKNPQSLFAAALISFSILCCIQLHLSFVLLLLLLGLALVLRFIPLPNWKGLLLGSLIGVIPLLPFLLTQGNDVGRSGHFVTSNVELHLEALLALPKIFFRFLSFSTAEITRFLSPNGGPLDAWRHLNQYPLLWPGYVIGTLASVWLILISLSFYFNRKRIKGFKKIWKTSKPMTVHEKLDFLVWTLPILIWIPFIFSIKGPSAHTFWVFMPLSFYPFLRMLPQWNYAPISLDQPVPTKFVLTLTIYLFLANTTALIGAALTPSAKLHATERLAREKFPALNLSQKDHLYGQGIHAIYRNLESSRRQAE